MSGHLLGESCSSGFRMFFLFLTDCNLSYFSLWFLDRTLVLIASVPGHAYLLFFIRKDRYNKI